MAKDYQGADPDRVWADETRTYNQTYNLADLDVGGDLRSWWFEQYGNDIERTAPKIAEYGTRDLVQMGHVMASGHGIEIDDPKAAVYGIMFYALGKVTRAIAALERGEMPSEDTLFDLSIYAMMARSYQDRGEL